MLARCGMILGQEGTGCANECCFFGVDLLFRWKVRLCDWGSTKVGCEEKEFMEREGEIRFVTYRSDIWN